MLLILAVLLFASPAVLFDDPKNRRRWLLPCAASATPLHRLHPLFHLATVLRNGRGAALLRRGDLVTVGSAPDSRMPNSAPRAIKGLW